MRKEKFDFGGWATKNDLLCADGRTIRRNAFKDDDGRTVPLVYQHNHEDPTRVIGHALLENRDEGVYAYGSLNNTDIAQHVKELIRHGDINGLSIYANKLTQRGGDVVHGTIRELSVVLAGANPGAVIEFPILEHGEESETEAYIWPGEEDGLNLLDGMSLSHADKAEKEEDEEEETEEEAKEETEVTEEAKTKETETKPEEKEESAEEETKEESKDEDEEEKKQSELKHADSEEDSKDETVQDVLNTLTDEQKQVVDKAIEIILGGEDKELPKEDVETLKGLNEKQQKVVAYLLEQAQEAAESVDEGENTEEDKEASHSDEEGEELIMANVFDQTNTEELKHDTLTSDQLATIAADMKKMGSLKEAVLAHSVEYGIENIDYLMPEYREYSGNGAPQFIKREDTWVTKVMNGVHHTPFSKVKTTFADITKAEARARGYVKGTRKQEEVFKLLKREVTPKTVYKKQKIDRDDAIDLSNGFDMVAWLKSEMRMMLDEELARAFIIGDGRAPDANDKIDEEKIIPVFKDDDLFVIRQPFAPEEGQARADALVDAVTYGWETYQGTGNCVAFMTRHEYAGLKLLKDKLGHRIYKNDSEIASALGVKEILFLPQMADDSTVRTDTRTDKIYKPLVIILDLNDYNVGADKGGSVNMFDDFDIDYNQMKYLIETRCSGALTKPYGAIVVEEEVVVEPDDDDEEENLGGEQ